MDDEILKHASNFLGINKKDASKIEYGDMTVLIFDMMYVFKSIITTSKVTTYDGIPIGGLYGTLNKITYYSKYFDADRVICVFDGDNAHEKRKKIDEAYKANRNDSFHMNIPFAMSAARKKENMKLQYIYLHRILKLLPVFMLREKNQEADDVICHLVTDVYKNNRRNIVVTGDSDMSQLVTKNTSIFNPRSNKEELITHSNVKEKLGIRPSNYVFEKAILGDSSDNIKGVSGIGKKTFEKYFRSFLKSINNVELEDFFLYIEANKEIFESTKRLKVLLTDETKKIIEKNYKLIQLREATLSLNETNNIINILKKPTKSSSERYLLEEFLKENNLYENINYYNFAHLYENLI